MFENRKEPVKYNYKGPDTIRVYKDVLLVEENRRVAYNPLYFQDDPRVTQHEA